jgi:hypothetical protein
MLHKGYNRKGSVAIIKKNKSLLVSLKVLGAKTK